MNQTHLHLLINHLPVFGSLCAAFVLAYALYVRSNQAKIAAYYLLIISAIGGVIAYRTGEPAEKAVKNIPGVLRDAIHEHEEAAWFALIAFIILAVLSIAALIMTNRNHPRSRTMAFIVLIFTVYAFSVVARVGYLGGLIRHTEVTESNAVNVEEDD